MTRVGEQWEHLTLSPGLEGPAQARRWVRQRLQAWGWATDRDGCVLVTSELVTNAVRHGKPPVGVDLRLCDGELQLDVTDGDPQGFAATDPGHEAERGRGILIAEAVSDDLRVEPLDDGKRVVAVWH